MFAHYVPGLCFLQSGMCASDPFEFVAHAAVMKFKTLKIFLRISTDVSSLVLHGRNWRSIFHAATWWRNPPWCWVRSGLMRAESLVLSMCSPQLSHRLWSNFKNLHSATSWYRGWKIGRSINVAYLLRNSLFWNDIVANQSDHSR